MAWYDALVSPFKTTEEDEKGNITNTGYDIGKIISAGTGALTLGQQAAQMFGLTDSGSNRPTGYQGGIPSYTATRTQVPNTYDPTRRPGSGGQRYFTDVDFGGGNPSTQAAGLEALNRANLAAQNRQGQQLAPIRAAQDAAAAQAAAQPVQQIASGGIVGFANGGSTDIVERKHKDGKIGLYTNNGSTFVGYKKEDAADSRFSFAKLKDAVGLAEGGIAGLKEGKFLDGRTDGMADEKPAMIDDEQPAALSDGEFVIPADVVSHLGNGNSDAGAKVLEDMMARVRKERTGSTKQGKEIDPEEFLPVQESKL